MIEKDIEVEIEVEEEEISKVIEVVEVEINCLTMIDCN